MATSNNNSKYVWVFNGSGNGNRFPSGCFTTRDCAIEWIKEYKLFGCLTKYPLDASAYDWCTNHGYFKPKQSFETSPAFIQNFSSRLEHYHFEAEDYEDDEWLHERFSFEEAQDESECPHDLKHVWVFCGPKGRFPSGCFTSLKHAASWISKTGVSGCLTEYPLDISVYDWAINKGYFRKKFPSHDSPEFIQKFSSASMTHYHIENGSCIDFEDIIEKKND